MMKIAKIQPIATNEVIRAVQATLENGKSFTAGFSATAPDFMLKRTDGTITATTKSAVLSSLKGYVAPADIKQLAVAFDMVRPIVAGKVQASVNVFAKAPKQYKAHCACCGAGLTDTVIDFCNRKLLGEMICFDCQKGPKGPDKEGASEASAPSTSSTAESISETPAQDSGPAAGVLEDVLAEMAEIRKCMEEDPNYFDSISVTLVEVEASEASVTLVPKESETCPKCLGTGLISRFAHVKSGKCFKCRGTGILTGTAPSRKSIVKESEVADADKQKTLPSEQSSAEGSVVIPNDAVAWTKSLEESLLESDLVADRR